MTAGDAERHRKVRSYVVRAGRMTDGQQRAMDQHWPRFGIEFTASPIDLDMEFGRVAPRVLEIGFGNGAQLAALADARRDADFLGIEVHQPGVGHLLLDAAQRNLSNLRVIRHDAVEVLQQLAPATLDEVLILFPDPWPKKRHHKRRIVQDAFLDLLAERLKPGGLLRLATDWQPYSEHVLETVARNAEYTNLSPTGDYVSRPADRTLTRFEKRGEKLGHLVRDLAWRRR